jgi:hypothetical protein
VTLLLSDVSHFRPEVPGHSIHGSDSETRSHMITRQSISRCINMEIGELRHQAEMRGRTQLTYLGVSGDGSE